MKIKSLVDTFYEDYEYYVNEDKKVVVAKCNDLFTKIYDKLDELISSNPRSWSFRYLLIAAHNIFKKRKDSAVVVKTTCLPNDKYSEDIGIEIARLKLEKKIIHIWNQIINEAVHAISKDAAELIGQTNRINRIDDAISNKIEQFFSDYSSKTMKK